jgi:phage/plasmid-associated DNA primase
MDNLKYICDVSVFDSIQALQLANTDFLMNSRQNTAYAELAKAISKPESANPNYYDIRSYRGISIEIYDPLDSLLTGGPSKEDFVTGVQRRSICLPLLEIHQPLSNPIAQIRIPNIVIGKSWRVDSKVFKMVTLKIIAKQLTKKLYKLYGGTIKLAISLKPYQTDLVAKFQVLSVLCDEGGRMQMVEMFKEIASTKIPTGIVYYTKYNSITNIFLDDCAWEFYECYSMTCEDGDYFFDEVGISADRIRMQSCNSVTGRKELVYRSGIVVESHIEESIERAKLLTNSYPARFIDMILTYLPTYYWQDEVEFGKLIKALKNNVHPCILEYHAQKSPHCLKTALQECGRDRFPYYARMVISVSPEGFAAAHKAFLVDYIIHTGTIGGGLFNHNEMGELFYYMTIGKYYYEYSGRVCSWFEHVEVIDNPVPGELYKWRQYPGNISPKSLSLSIVDAASECINDAIVLIEANGETIKGDKLVKNLHKLKWSFGQNTVQMNIRIKLGEMCRGSDVMTSMNTDGGVVGVRNGILDMDLNSKDPRPHLCQAYSEYFVNKSTNANYIPYDPSRKYVRIWHRIFNDVFIEPDACEYMWYRFSTMLDEMANVIDFLFITAGGCNGKSVIADNILYVLGKYGSMLSTHLLTDKSRAGAADPELMQTRGIRGGIITETQDNDTLNTARMKTTSESIKTGRGLYEDSCNFRSVVTITVFSNFQFNVTDVDHGTWRRILAYWPKCKFLENPDPNNHFEKKINPSYSKLAESCQEAADDLLSILVHYRCELTRKYGGILSNVKSPTIEAETSKYHIEQDTYTEFIKRRLLRLSGFNSSVNNAYLDTPAILELYEQYGLRELYITQLALIDGYKKWLKEVKGRETSHSNDTIIKNFKESLIGKYFSNYFIGETFADEMLIGFRIGCDKHDTEYFV